MNGDEAMCFGSAFIAANNSKEFRMKPFMLTTHLEFDVMLKISPIDSDDAVDMDNNYSENTDEADAIQYDQEIQIFNKTDFLGKSTSLTINYDRNARLEIFRIDEGDASPIILESYLLDDIKSQYEKTLS